MIFDIKSNERKTIRNIEYKNVCISSVAGWRLKCIFLTITLQIGTFWLFTNLQADSIIEKFEIKNNNPNNYKVEEIQLENEFESETIRDSILQKHINDAILQKFNQLGYETRPHSACSPDISSTDCHFFKYLDHHFMQGKLLKTQTDTENTFSSRTLNFYSIEIANLLPRSQKCVDSNYAYFAWYSLF